MSEPKNIHLWESFYCAKWIAVHQMSSTQIAQSLQLKLLQEGKCKKLMHQFFKPIDNKILKKNATEIDYPLILIENVYDHTLIFGGPLSSFELVTQISTQLSKIASKSHAFFIDVYCDLHQWGTSQNGQIKSTLKQVGHYVDVMGIPTKMELNYLTNHEYTNWKFIEILEELIGLPLNVDEVEKISQQPAQLYQTNGFKLPPLQTANLKRSTILIRGENYKPYTYIPPRYYSDDLSEDLPF